MHTKATYCKILPFQMRPMVYFTHKMKAYRNTKCKKQRAGQSLLQHGSKHSCLKTPNALLLYLNNVSIQTY